MRIKHTKKHRAVYVLSAMALCIVKMYNMCNCLKGRPKAATTKDGGNVRRSGLHACFLVEAVEMVNRSVAFADWFGMGNAVKDVLFGFFYSID